MRAADRAVGAGERDVRRLAMGRNCEECTWCLALRGTHGVDCDYYRLYFDDRARAASCPHFEKDEEEEED